MIANARADTVSREVLRHVEFEGKVALGRVRDHFLCEFSFERASSRTDLRNTLAVSIESAGQYEPKDLLPESAGVLLAKIRNVRKCLTQTVGA